MPIYLYLYKRLSLKPSIFLPIPIDVYSRLHSHVYRLCSHGKLSRSHVYHMDVHLSLHVYPYIYPYLGVYQYFLSTTLLVADNSTTGAWHLDQLAIEEERAKEHKRQRGQMGKCERNLIGNRGSANASSSSTI